jgi:hypothetical protein
MLDEIKLFWLTDTAASSARIYLEQAQLMGKRNNPGRVELPVGVSVFPNEICRRRAAARRWSIPSCFTGMRLTVAATSPSSKYLNFLPRSCASAFSHFAAPDGRVLKSSENHDVG